MTTMKPHQEVASSPAASRPPAAPAPRNPPSFVPQLRDGDPNAGWPAPLENQARPRPVKEQDAREQSTSATGRKLAEENGVTSCDDNDLHLNGLQADESHQNFWGTGERPTRHIRNLINATPIHGGRSRNGHRNFAYRQRQMEEGLVLVRMLLLHEVHAAVTQLRDRYGFDSLGSAIDAFLLVAERRVNIATLAMPRRHSTAEPYVECNAMVSEQARAFLDRIKSMHGLSRYYAFEALLAALPDPWASLPVDMHPNINPEKAVSG